MNRYLVLCSLLAAIGSGVMAGFFYSFSNVVMGALRRIPPVAAIAAMQSINVVVLNPLFFALFFGTALLGLVLVVAALVGGGDAGGLAALGGGLVYLVAVIGVTVARNVPMNDRLAAVDGADPASLAPWEDYLRRWTLWNHVRTAGALAACVLFALAAARGT
ncbi:MAG: DUF1772 domain-containing protein [Gemmatimonadota bacterium]